MIARSFSIPDSIQTQLRHLLHAEGIGLDSLESLATQVMKLSDQFTQSEGKKTPWEFWSAYMVYFFPLNLVRLQAVVQELR